MEKLVSKVNKMCEKQGDAARKSLDSIVSELEDLFGVVKKSGIDVKELKEAEKLIDKSLDNLLDLDKLIAPK
jgi:hypothetical protein